MHLSRHTNTDLSFAACLLDLHIREGFRVCAVGVWMFQTESNEIYIPLVSESEKKWQNRGELIDAIYEQKLQ